MEKHTYKCPHCNDEWNYNLIVRHGNDKAIVTNNYNFLENGQECTCFKCGHSYNLDVIGEPDLTMDDFVYHLWKNCKPV